MLQNKSFLNRKTLNYAIQNAKSLLIDYAEKHGIYENFGQIQVGLIQDKFIDISIYTKEMNHNRDMVNCFSKWCSGYDMSNS